MRTIKFRGKRVDNGKWIYGYYVIDPAGKSRIYWQPFSEATSNTYHFVSPETVGQFIGLTDKTKVEIYEGDIVSMDANAKKISGTVEYIDSLVKFVVKSTDWDYSMITKCNHAEVIGNIHDK